MSKTILVTGGCGWLGKEAMHAFLTPTLSDTPNAVNRTVPGAKITIGGHAPLTLDGAVISTTMGALHIRRAREELGYRPHFDIQHGIEPTRAQRTRVAS